MCSRHVIKIQPLHFRSWVRVFLTCLFVFVCLSSGNPPILLHQLLRLSVHLPRALWHLARPLRCAWVHHSPHTLRHQYVMQCNFSLFYNSITHRNVINSNWFVINSRWFLTLDQTSPQPVWLKAAHPSQPKMNVQLTQERCSSPFLYQMLDGHLR